MTKLAVALGVRSPKLDAPMREFFRDARPWGFILFREACVSKEQVTALCQDLRDAVGHDAVIYIDQEGGPVARLKAPEWPVWPAAAKYGELYRKDHAHGLAAARLGYRLIAHELKSMGVDGDYAPVLDTPVDGADPIIGDRAFSRDGDVIAELGRAALSGLADGGVVGCIKHLPGHGRAEADSHLHLPRVKASADELEIDIAPFKALCDAPAAMTAHIVYEAWDPQRPATCSKKVISEIIRGEIGFDGLLKTDDLDMKAMAPIGDLRERAEAALKAGCDMVLQCSGDLEEMKLVVQGCAKLDGRALDRAKAVEAIAKHKPVSFDVEESWARFNALMDETAKPA